MESVLVPIDGSPLAERALQFTFRHHPAAAVTGLHVQNPRDPAYGAAIMEDDEVLAGATSEGQAYLDTVTERVRSAAEAIASDYETPFETDTVVGDPARAIVDYAADNDVDHIVMGSHGRTGRDRLLIGSVAESVVRRSAGNVTVIRE
jgi:nucleotide-binding universal stress UspA family protein